eukprot:CAMPEP_0171313998 /NCGR_PEP_ID=MMETSP0816-20121228/47651_1 /TAXON_ID=420281 /ORGANISM="Proboscia inermis, Strain CCAP1064/1" /LENGTH=90 /DNA_ID=CAMNT_0011802277 /DNA_START=381 /DNA_END=653 /DNA_ORIENTATION=-
MIRTTNAPTVYTRTDALTHFVTTYTPSSNPPMQSPTTITATNLLRATTTTILNTNPPTIIAVLSTDVPTNSSDTLCSMDTSTVITDTPMT